MFEDLWWKYSVGKFAAADKSDNSNTRTGNTHLTFLKMQNIIFRR